MAHTEDLITLLAVAGRPVRVDEAVETLKIGADEVLTAVEELVEAGQALDTSEGIAKSASTPEPKSASRTSYLAGKWAEALDTLGGDHTEIGLAYLAAGQYAKAADHLVPVALGEATSVAVNAALAAGEHGNFYSKVTEGQLHLSRAAHRSAAGDTLGASADLEVAIRNLEGAPLVDALQSASEVASNLQHPQQSEALAALGALQATRVGEPAKQGSLLTLQGRELARLGFPLEADRAIEVGRALVNLHGTADQKDIAHWHAAWVMFDRGEFRNAESEFSSLRDRAKDGNPVLLGAREAYWARALFGNGRATEALEATERAEVIASQTGADVPAFLAGLARMEGALNFARYEDAVSEAQSVLETIRRSLPQWENVGLVGLARAYAGTGEVEKAHEALDAAEAATPAGIDGWRWRIHAQEVRVSLTPESEPWPQKDAEDLTDALLQARWFDSAAHLMCIRSHREKDRDLGVEAAALALQIGNPMLAARAVESAGVWDDDVAVPVARAVRQVEQHVPAAWLDQWRSVDSVAHAYEVNTDVDVDTDELTAHIDEALQAAGLAGTDVILSPAQRQAKGLVRRRPRRRLGTGALVGVAAGVAVLSVGLAFALFTLLGPRNEILDPNPTTTTAPRMEDTIVPMPEDGIYGTAELRGGDSRDGVFEDSGFRKVIGQYWTNSPGGFFSTNPISYGFRVYLGSATDEELLIYAEGTLERETLGSPVSSEVAVKQVDAPLSGSTTYLVFGTEDGVVHGLNAFQYADVWATEVGGVVRTVPLFVETELGVFVVVATDTGSVLGLDMDEGTVEWRYDGSAEGPLAPVHANMAYHDGVIYVMDSEGTLHLIGTPEPPPPTSSTTTTITINDPSGGDQASQDTSGAPTVILEAVAICQHQYPGPLAIGSNPVISGEIVYLPTADWGIWMTKVGECNRQPEDRLTPQIETTNERGIQFAPIVHRDIIYVVDNARLVAIDSSALPERRFDHWEMPFNAESTITGAPVMSGGVIYLGTQDGRVIAVDAETGSGIWEFDAGESIRGSVAVVRSGAVFATTSAGQFIAIAVEE